MTNPFSFFVSGVPRPKQSFKVTGKGRGVANPLTVEWQETVQVAWLELVMGGQAPECDEKSRFAVELHFNTTAKRAGDCDNLAKAVLDALNRLTWKDDDQVDQLYVTKIINKGKPGVLIRITSTPV